MANAGVVLYMIVLNDILEIRNLARFEYHDVLHTVRGGLTSTITRAFSNPLAVLVEALSRFFLRSDLQY